MADTDLPNGFGALNRAPRPIASPFGALPTQGFNVQPDTAPTNPMASLSNFMPSRDNVANTLGAPVDALAWALHKMGLPISGDTSYGGGGLGNTGINGQPTWAPGPDVPFSSQFFRHGFNNPDWKQSLAENLGAPVDMASWALMKLGMPIPRAPTNTPYMASDGSRGTWAPSASVPLGSQNIRGILDNPPSLDRLLRAMRRPGLF
jgi:hypothetical protein